ncbi:hypothetical protein U0070_005304 [Myodes glareolus]|uniref:Small ribosomal subunit protein uS5 C-terminal domain-containing protein n=1 Tax=Myodes glareolus TaxID=447135 RepID=A0AAW0I412_MYOGA
MAKLSLLPVLKGSWGNKTGKSHTDPSRGIGTISAPVPKKLLMTADIDECNTSARGCTATLGDFAKTTFNVISKTYS